MSYKPFELYTDEYEQWFKDNKNIFKSELDAIKKVFSDKDKSLEIGIGSGIFAEKLNVDYGIDPSEKMLKYAKKRNISVKKAYAENLPFKDKSFDSTLFITSICFIDNPQKAISEAYRVLSDEGNIIIAFIDRESTIGQNLEKEKNNSKFYQPAKFFSVEEVKILLESNNLKITEIYQTLISPSENKIEEPVKGSGKGSFVVIKAEK